jgi:hypothetical protein
MAASVTPSAVLVPHFHDSQGNLLSGGQLFTYVAGTTTPVTTYTDSTGSTAQTNPIILNARGEPQNDLGASVGIWGAVGTLVKFVLEDSSGNVLWTLDNVPMGGSGITLSELANIAAGTLIGNNGTVAAPPSALTATQATAMLNAMVGDTGSGGTAGLVPAPPAGSTAANDALMASGSFGQVGYIGVPIDDESATYAFVAADVGRTKYFTATATATIPAGLPVGSVLDAVWAATQTGTVTPGTGTTLTNPNGGATGSRTVTGLGSITMQAVALNTWIVRSGVNVS